MNVDPCEVVGEVVQPVGLLRVDAVNFVRVPILVTEEGGKSVDGVRGTGEQVQKARSPAYARGRQVLGMWRRGRIMTAGEATGTDP